MIFKRSMAYEQGLAYIETQTKKPETYWIPHHAPFAGSRAYELSVSHRFFRSSGNVVASNRSVMLNISFCAPYFGQSRS